MSRRQGDQSQMFGCGGVEQEVVLATGADLINVTVFVCSVY
jgi:hypothetical protein